MRNSPHPPETKDGAEIRLVAIQLVLQGQYQEVVSKEWRRRAAGAPSMSCPFLLGAGTWKAPRRVMNNGQK